MRRDCNYLVQTYVGCQRRARITYHDRTPIKYFARLNVHQFCSFISLRTLKYQLCCSYKLLSLISWQPRHISVHCPIMKGHSTDCMRCTCSCFSHTSLPVAIISDNTSYFKTKLNQEFMKRLDSLYYSFTSFWQSVARRCDEHLLAQIPFVNVQRLKVMCHHVGETCPWDPSWWNTPSTWGNLHAVELTPKLACGNSQWCMNMHVHTR